MKRWVALLLVVAFVLVAGSCSSDGDDAPEVIEGDKDLTLWLTRPHEPYPYVTPVPELEPTVVDGTYRRAMSVKEAGGYPVACRRCSPYRLEAGVSRLRLERGRFLVRHKPALPPKKCKSCKRSEGFTSIAHFFVTEDRIEFFNDANCPQERGVYEWTIRDGRLVFDVVSDDCPFGQLRARYLTSGRWAIP